MKQISNQNRKRSVKWTILSVLLCMLFLLPRSGVAADKVPENMQEHLAWARSTKTLTERIKRLEGFWVKYLPREEGGIDPSMGGYGDGSHIYAICGCAWDLARAYVEAGDKEKALKTLEWIQKYDSRSRLPSSSSQTEGKTGQPVPTVAK